MLFARLRLQAGECVQRAERAGNDLRRDMGVTRRCVDAAMAEQYLDDACVGAAFQQVRGEAVAQPVGGDSFVEPTLLRSVSFRQACVKPKNQDLFWANMRRTEVLPISWTN